MRVDTLFEPKAAEFLNKNFILVTHNQLPELYCSGRSIDTTRKMPYPKAQMSIATEGAGGGNVRSYFCSPDGKVIHFVAGFWKPERYIAEANWALRLLDTPSSKVTAERDHRLVELERERDAHTPPAEVERLANLSARQSLNPSHEPAPKGLNRLREVAAFNRLIRSHQETGRFSGMNIREVLRLVEDEVYTKGAVGCDF